MDCSPPTEQIFYILFSLLSQCVSQARFASHISNLALKTELLISCRLFLWGVLLQRLNTSQIQSGYFLATSVREEVIINPCLHTGKWGTIRLHLQLFSDFWIPSLGYLGSDISGWLAGYGTFLFKMQLPLTSAAAVNTQHICKPIVRVLLCLENEDCINHGHLQKVWEQS